MDMKLELLPIPVTDVDRAKAFYSEQVGFAVDFDHAPNEEMRMVQLTPPGSGCSIMVGTGTIDTAPGSVRGVQLVVDAGPREVPIPRLDEAVERDIHEVDESSHRSTLAACHRSCRAGLEDAEPSPAQGSREKYGPNEKSGANEPKGASDGSGLVDGSSKSAVPA